MIDLPVMAYLLPLSSGHRIDVKGQVFDLSWAEALNSGVSLARPRCAD